MKSLRTINLDQQSGSDESNSYCVDELEDCPTWASSGECLTNPLFMLVTCKYSCWKCVNIQKDRELGVDETITAKKMIYSKMNTGANQFVSRPSSDATADVMQNHQDLLTWKQIISMEQYAKHVIADPSIPNKTRERCFNQHRMCATWAAVQGMCLPFGYDVKIDQRRSSDDASLAGKESVLFMMNMCPLACEMCHEITSFHRCAGKRLPWEKPSFDVVNWSINSFFERKRYGSEWKAHQPTFVSYPNAEVESSKDDPFVVVLQNFLSSDEADTLKSLPSSATAGWNLQDDAQSHRVVASCPNNNACGQDETYTKIMDRISSLVDVKVSHLEPIEMIQFENSIEPKTIKRLEHNFKVSSLWKPAGPRVLSLFIFLSDVNNNDEGQGGSGGLGFPYLDWLYIKPKKGMAVLWSNVKSEDLWQLDPMTKFEHFPLQQDEGGDGKVHFGAFSHVRLYNYTDAYLRGCV